VAIHAYASQWQLTLLDIVLQNKSFISGSPVCVDTTAEHALRMLLAYFTFQLDHCMLSDSAVRTEKVGIQRSLAV
jgi:hypothetical protein